MNTSAAEANASQPAGWAESFIPFVRHEDGKATTVAMLTVWSDGLDPEAIVEALKRALTKWVKTTDSGAQCWRDSEASLNIGDMLAEGISSDGEFQAILRASGVVIADGVVADCGEARVFDEVLVDEAALMGCEAAT